MNAPIWIERKLEEKHSQGNYRRLKVNTFELKYNFASNDYLALSTNSEILSEINNLKQIGACASRLVCGDTEDSFLLESELAEYFGFESSLIFSSGFLANFGLLSTLVRKEDVVFSDKLIHASLIEGIRLTNCKHFRFVHNDLNHLEEFLKTQSEKRKEGQNYYLVIESLYSMNGDSPDFISISNLSKKYNCILIIDESHAVGVYGEGLSKKINKDNLILTGTFSKAFGTYGGFICGPAWLKEFLVNSSRALIYNTALPQLLIKASRKSLDIIKKDPSLGEGLLANSNYFREKLGLKTLGTGQIVSLIVNSSNEALKISEELSIQGFLVPAIRPPTVSKALLRISLTLHHSKENLLTLSQTIKGML